MNILEYSVIFFLFQVYTVNLESRYLLIQGVPALGVMKELVEQFALYGAIEEYHALDEYPAEQFTEVYLIKFQKLQCARYWTGQYLSLAVLIFHTFFIYSLLRFYRVEVKSSLLPLQFISLQGGQEKNGRTKFLWQFAACVLCSRI